MNEYLVQTKDLSKQYGDFLAADKINLHVKKGRIYGLLGRNGAGKTTIMKMLLGLCSMTSGTIDFWEKAEQARAKIGSTIESPGFYGNLSAAENLSIFTGYRGGIPAEQIKQVLSVVDLPYEKKKPFGEFSLGMKQRLALANAMVNDPELLILDEPTNGLDPIGIAEIRSLIKSLCGKGKTVLLSSHQLSEIELLADDIGIIDHGVLLEEISSSQLEEKNRKEIEVSVMEMEQACNVLETHLGIKAYEVDTHGKIIIKELCRSTLEINKALTEAGCGVLQIYRKTGSLEDYFKEITGGGGIG